MGKYSITPSESRDFHTESWVATEGREPLSGVKRKSRITRARLSSSSTKGFCFVCIGLFAMSVVAPVFGVPTVSSRQTDLANGGEAGSFEEDVFEDEQAEPRALDQLDDLELDKIRRSIMEGLGLTRIPDPSKANVSQAEYERAHGEYLKRVQLSSFQGERTRRRLHTFHAAEHPRNRSRRSPRATDDLVHSMFFPVGIPSDQVTVDHASLRLFLDGHVQDGHLDVLIYQPTPTSRRLISQAKIPVRAHESRWIELDSTEAAASWIEDGLENLGLDLEFRDHGVPVRRSISSSALNVFTTSDVTRRHRRAAPEHMMSLHKGRRTECRGESKKCCRHQMSVIFKDLKGFEFIIQPKTFDAGYCKGRCPPRYNPANHHALLQSLIWKEDRKKAPRPCCAPSKLTELEILYFDENDSTKLKVSNWKNMKVLECACS